MKEGRKTLRDSPICLFTVPHACTQIISRVGSLLAECEGQEVTVIAAPNRVALKDLRFNQVFLPSSQLRHTTDYITDLFSYDL